MPWQHYEHTRVHCSFQRHQILRMTLITCENNFFERARLGMYVHHPTTPCQHHRLKTTFSVPEKGFGVWGLWGFRWGCSVFIIMDTAFGFWSFSALGQPLPTKPQHSTVRTSKYCSTVDKRRRTQRLPNVLHFQTNKRTNEQTNNKQQTNCASVCCW